MKKLIAILITAFICHAMVNASDPGTITGKLIITDKTHADTIYIKPANDSIYFYANKPVSFPRFINSIRSELSDSIYIKGFGYLSKHTLDSLSQRSGSGKNYFSGQGINIGTNRTISLGDSITSTRNIIYINPDYSYNTLFRIGQNIPFDYIGLIASTQIDLIAVRDTSSGIGGQYISVDPLTTTFGNSSHDSIRCQFKTNNTTSGSITGKNNELYFQNNLGVRKSLSQLAGGGNVFANTGNITAGTGITVAMLANDMRYNGGSAIDISANPQIVAGYDGQEIEITGLSDANTLKLDDGDGLQLAGGTSFTLGAGDVIHFKYITSLSVWRESFRSDN